MAIRTFDQFINESQDDIKPSAIKNAAGVAIVWQDSILLVHPTGASWQKNTLGIPKGGIEPGEDPIESAVRELREEVGISIDPSRLESEPLVANNYDKDGKLKWQLIYFVLRINDPTEVGLKDSRVPNSQLQIEEVDWAGFVPINVAYSKMHRPQLIILDRLR